jgi:hypothetical protein
VWVVLVDGDLAHHSGSLVWLAVEAVGSRDGEGDGECFPCRVEVLLLRDLGDVDAAGHLVLVEDYVVRVAGVVLEGDGVAGLDGELAGLEDERAAVGAQKHLLRHGAAGQHGAGGNGNGGGGGLAKGGAHGEGGPPPAPAAEGRPGGDGGGGKGGHSLSVSLSFSSGRQKMPTPYSNI